MKKEIRSQFTKCLLDRNCCGVVKTMKVFYISRTYIIFQFFLEMYLNLLVIISSYYYGLYHKHSDLTTNSVLVCSPQTVSWLIIYTYRYIYITYAYICVFMSRILYVYIYTCMYTHKYHIYYHINTCISHINTYPLDGFIQ